MGCKKYIFIFNHIMKKFKHIIIVSCLSCLLFACSKMQVIESDNISRTVKFTYNNGDIKIINQKFNYKYSTWISAECVAKNINSFGKCPKDKIDYTKFGKMQIAHLQDQSLNESKHYVQSQTQLKVNKICIDIMYKHRY